MRAVTRSGQSAAKRASHLLCVASVIPRKGQDLLVEALARVADLPWSCVCAGSLNRDPGYVARVRQLIGRLGGGRGHRTFAGTPEQVADTIVEWAEAGAADGFNVMPPVLPSGLEAFTDHVIPLLRQRGVFRTEYSGRTLREHYGIPRPENVFALAGQREVSMAGS